MKKNKFINHNPKRDNDTVAISLFLKCLSWALPFLCLLGIIYGYKLGGVIGAIKGFFLCAIVSLFASFLTMIISDKLSEIAIFLYKGPKAKWSVKEQLEGSLNQVRYHKMNKRFDRALLTIEDVLAKEPNFPNALFLKASILWEGFSDADEAKRCLGTIINTTSKSDNFYHWASSLYSDIVKEEKKQLNEKQDDKT